MKLWLDVETGGLDAASCALLSVALVLDDDSASLYLRIRGNPTLQVTEEALAINGLDPSWGMDEEDAAKAIAAFLAPLGKYTFAGANVKFDMAFLSALAQRTGVNLHMRHRALDIQSAAMLAQDVGVIHVDSFSLDSLAANFYMGRESQEHNALEDAKLARSVYHELVLALLPV